MNVLEEAAGLVYAGDRNRDYGHPRDNMKRTAALIHGYMTAINNRELAARDIPLLMILVKMARLEETPDHRDSVVDLAGWAAVYSRTVGLDE